MASGRGKLSRRSTLWYLTWPCRHSRVHVRLAGAQIHVFSKTPAKTAGPGDARKASAGPGHGSMEALGDADYHLVLEYKIGGPLTYVTASTHCKRFADIAVDYVLLNLSRVTEIDIDGIAALEVAAR